MDFVRELASLDPCQKGHEEGDELSCRFADKPCCAAATMDSESKGGSRIGLTFLMSEQAYRKMMRYG